MKIARKMLIGVLSGFLLLAVAPLRTYADPCGCGGKGGPGRQGPGEMGAMHHRRPFLAEGFPAFLWRNLMRLDLSDKQKDALKEIRSRVAKETIRKRADLEIGRVELRELLDKDPVDMKAVEANLRKAEGQKTDLRLSRIKALEAAKSQLTKEQKAKLKEMIRAGFARERRHGRWSAQDRTHEIGNNAGGE